MRDLMKAVVLGVVAGTTALGVVGPHTAAAQIAEREGWVVIDTDIPFAELAERLNAAISANGMGRVTRASASDGARNQGFEILGNVVVGVYRNDFARRMLEASVAAGIEAPIRIYVAEREGGGATLSYKTPSFVFAPYFDEGGEALRTLAAELDEIFAAIARDATAG